MKKRVHTQKITGLTGLFLLLPHWLFAQTSTGSSQGLQGILDQVYAQMIPLCRPLIGVSRGIAGFAALWYIGYRVWGHIARAEPIDFFPLLRPFALGFAILIFPSLLGLMNGVLQPVVEVTNGMVLQSNQAISRLLQQEASLTGSSAGMPGSPDPNFWYAYGQAPGSAGSAGADQLSMAEAALNFNQTIRVWMSEGLTVLFQAASLCISTIRTFFLIVLAILGPLALGLSVFDGLQHTLMSWVSRYIHVFLWLPVANIFGSILGKIQEQMLLLDLHQLQTTGQTYFNSTDTAYLIFLVIGIIGYFTVPSVAGYIVHGGGGHTLLHHTTSLTREVSHSALQILSGSSPGVVGSSVNTETVFHGPADRTGANGGGSPGRSAPGNTYNRDRISGT
ncbi:MAG: conjugative transposon protein TraJ [Chitinophagaceae bacterium]